MLISSASQYNIYLPCLGACIASSLNSVLNASRCFNQEKALVGAFFVIVKKMDQL